MSTPPHITDGKSSSIAALFAPGADGAGRKVAITAAKAPVAPLTMPGRPPKRPQISPTIHAECSATGGRTCAISANAIDSGICAKQMTTPSIVSRTTTAAVTGGSASREAPPASESRRARRGRAPSSRAGGGRRGSVVESTRARGGIVRRAAERGSRTGRAAFFFELSFEIEEFRTRDRTRLKIGAKIGANAPQRALCAACVLAEGA